MRATAESQPYRHPVAAHKPLLGAYVSVFVAYFARSACGVWQSLQPVTAGDRIVREVRGGLERSVSAGWAPCPETRRGRPPIEDTRQAVIEARLQRLVPFCLTVDREAPAYVPAVFGQRGYALLRRPELLAQVLVDVVRNLVTA